MIVYSVVVEFSALYKQLDNCVVEISYIFLLFLLQTDFVTTVTSRWITCFTSYLGRHVKIFDYGYG